jgi:ABC-type transporter Mla subunit MlaD
MTESVESVISELSNAANKMSESVSSLVRVTSSTVGEMNAGAAKLGEASRDFANAGNKVSEVLGQTVTVSTKLAETSGALSTGGSAIQELLRDYQNHRTTVSSLVAELRATVDAAKKEATLTADILNRIENSAQRLSTAQLQADEYLDGVSRVLGDAHSSFATEVKRTLDKANNQFHEKLASATGLLHSSVEELGVTLGAMGNLTPKKG